MGQQNRFWKFVLGDGGTNSWEKTQEYFDNIQVAGTPQAVVAAWIEFFVKIILPGGEDHLELYSVHKYRPVFPHDRIPLQIRTEEDISQPRAVILREGTCCSIIQVDADVGNNDIESPFPTE